VQVVQTVSLVQQMHVDASRVMLSEIICDVVYAIFYEGARFSSKAKRQETIINGNSPIQEIEHEISTRLGCMPEDKDLHEMCPRLDWSRNSNSRPDIEDKKRLLMRMLVQTSLIWHGQAGEKELYDMRSQILEPIAGGCDLSSFLRVFMQKTKLHYTFKPRIVGVPHEKYRQEVAVFLQNVGEYVTEKNIVLLMNLYDKKQEIKDGLIENMSSQYKAILVQVKKVTCKKS